MLTLPFFPSSHIPHLWTSPIPQNNEVNNNKATRHCGESEIEGFISSTKLETKKLRGRENKLKNKNMAQGFHGFCSSSILASSCLLLLLFFFLPISASNVVYPQLGRRSTSGVFALNFWCITQQIMNYLGAFFQFHSFFFNSTLMICYIPWIYINSLGISTITNTFFIYICIDVTNSFKICIITPPFVWWKFPSLKGKFIYLWWKCL